MSNDILALSLDTDYIIARMSMDAVSNLLGQDLMPFYDILDHREYYEMSRYNSMLAEYSIIRPIGENNIFDF